MRLLFLAALVVVAAGRASGQQPMQSVRGVVRDSGGVALAGAEVTVGKRTATTDAKGAYVVDSLHPGTYLIVVRLVGYAPVRSRVGVVASEATVADYFLMPAPFLLPTIVVSSKRTGIYGTVGDTGYRAAVGARVQVAGHRGGESLTDSSGRFAFPEADHGSYMVRVTFKGYTERRFLIELKKGEGKELAVLLAPHPERWAATDPGTIQDLGMRLSFGLERDRMMGEDLVRYAGRGVCDVPRITGEIGRRTTTLILNGSTILRDFPVSSLCAWSVDELELIEYGHDICADDTHTLASTIKVLCLRRGRAVPMPGIPKADNPSPMISYVVLWEKR